jgi:hypothetical protein|tara:strand:+ start:984 stop:1268 length:285 start_codon:yes stop_codon:yes gene_type:complete
MKSSLIQKAIQEIDNTTAFSIVEDDTQQITWITGNVAEQDIINKINEIATRDAYILPRVNSYPSIVDQLDDIYHNGIDAWKATIKVTKDKYPKE